MNATEDNLFEHCTFNDFRYFAFANVPPKPVLNNLVAGCVVNVFLFMTTLFLNGVSVLTIVKCPKLKEKISYFLIMLHSVADLAVGLISIPLTSYIYVTEAQGTASCYTQRMVTNIAMIPILSSTVSLQAMTVERYFGVIHPLKHRTMITKRKLVLCFAFGSLSEVTLYMVVVFFHGQFLGTFFTIGAIVFLCVTTFVYTKIFLAIRKSNSAWRAGDNATSSRQNMRRVVLKEIKLVKSCFLAVICFLTCLVLAGVLQSFRSSVDMRNYLILNIWGAMTAFLNSSLNSVIFFWTKPLLKDEALKVLKILWCLKR